VYKSEIFKKNSNDNTVGEKIPNVKGYAPIFSKDNKYIIYTNANDIRKLYRKNIEDDSIGTPIT
jgi:hypothetical protein